MRRLSPLCALLALLFAACGADGITEIVVLVDSDIALDSVVLTVTRSADEERVTADIAATGFPFSQGLVHESGPLGPVRIVAEGFMGGTMVVRSQRLTSFIENETQTVTVQLASACLNVVCADAETCSDGRCVPVEGRDAGVEDAGIDDGGADAAVDAPLDANGDVSTPDGGVDAPFDAGTDALIDAPTDVPIDTPPPDTGACPSGQQVVSGSYVCPPGCLCLVRCDEGATCTIGCAEAAQCVIEVGASASALVMCANGNCETTVEENASLDINCMNGTCSSDCTSGAECMVGCGGGASGCLLECGTARADCAFSTCIRNETDCGGAVRSCNRTSCP